MNLNEIFGDWGAGEKLFDSSSFKAFFELFASQPMRSLEVPKQAKRIRTAAWINKTFYYAYSRTLDFRSRLANLSVEPFLRDIENIIVWRGPYGNSGLLAMVPSGKIANIQLQRDIPFKELRQELVHDIEINQDIIADDLALETGTSLGSSSLRLLILNQSGAIVDDVTQRTMPIMALAPAPAMEATSGVPSSPASIDARQLGIRKESTAGVAAYDGNGACVLTAALHGVSDPGATITVGGASTSILNSSAVVDTAVLTRDAAVDAALSGLNSVRDVLKRAPYSGEQMHFSGRINIANANILPHGHDLGVPRPSRGTQLKIYTNRVTDEGDSGSALITVDDFVAGFAFKKSSPSDLIQCSSWVWAYSVFDDLSLTF